MFIRFWVQNFIQIMRSFCLSSFYFFKEREFIRAHRLKRVSIRLRTWHSPLFVFSIIVNFLSFFRQYCNLSIICNSYKVIFIMRIEAINCTHYFKLHYYFDYVNNGVIWGTWINLGWSKMFLLCSKRFNKLQCI